MINLVAAATPFTWKLLSEATWAEGAYSKISRLRKSGTTVAATHVRTGIRSRFRVVEHANIGRGYMTRDTEGRVSGLLSEWDLMNIKAVA